MRTMTPDLKMRFRAYVEEAINSTRNLEFLLDNLSEPVTLDYSVDSLKKVEAVFWRCVREGFLEDISDPDHFAHLIGQYVGESIIHHTGTRWVQCSDANALFGQPCIDGFGEHSWDRIFLVEIASHIQDLPKAKPNFPGVREGRVFASALERAISVHRRNT